MPKFGWLRSGGGTTLTRLKAAFNWTTEQSANKDLYSENEITGVTREAVCRCKYHAIRDSCGPEPRFPIGLSV